MLFLFTYLSLCAHFVVKTLFLTPQQLQDKKASERTRCCKKDAAREVYTIANDMHRVIKPLF